MAVTLVESRITIRTGQTVWTSAHIVKPSDQSIVLQADVSGTPGAEITVSVFDMSGLDPTNEVFGPTTLNMATDGPSSGAIIPAAALDTAFWTLNSDGQNFIHGLDGAAVFTKGGHAYKVVYAFEVDGGSINFGEMRVVTWVDVLAGMV